MVKALTFIKSGPEKRMEKDISILFLARVSQETNFAILSEGTFSRAAHISAIISQTSFNSLMSAFLALNMSGAVISPRICVTICTGQTYSFVILCTFQYRIDSLPRNTILVEPLPASP